MQGDDITSIFDDHDHVDDNSELELLALWQYLRQ